LHAYHTLLNLKISVDMLLLNRGMLIRYELGIQFDRPQVWSRSVVEVEIKESILHFLFDAIFVGNSQQVIGVESQKKIDFPLFYLFIIEDKCFHPKATDMLQRVDDTIIHHRE
jgi:hypothetical protein